MPRQLTQLRLNEVSLVDSPANKLARVMYFKHANKPADGNYPSAVLKREFTADERKARADNGHAMSDGSFPIDNKSDLENAIRAIGRAKNPAKAKAHIKSRASALGASDMLPDTWDKRDSGVAVIKFLITRDAKLAKYGDNDAVDFDTAQQCAEESEAALGLINEVNEAVCSLSSSIWSINYDATVSDKGGAIAQSLDQFAEHVKTIVPEGVENALVAQSLSDAGFRLNALGGIELSKGVDSTMTKAIAKSLGLPETATEAEIVAKLAENDKVAKLNECIAKMSAKHKAYMDHPDATMPSGGKEKFAEMEPAQRDSHMASNPIEDEEDDMEKRIKKGDAFRSEDGVVLTKKDFGTDAGFQFAKGQAAKLATANENILKSAEREDIAKRVAFAKSDAILLGKPEELGNLLHKTAQKDPALADQWSALMKGWNGIVAAGNVFKESGSSRGGIAAGSAAEQINKMADELVKADTTGAMTVAKARVAIRRKNPELRDKEEAEAKDKKKAA